MKKPTDEGDDMGPIGTLSRRSPWMAAAESLGNLQDRLLKTSEHEFDTASEHAAANGLFLIRGCSGRVGHYVIGVRGSWSLDAYVVQQRIYRGKSSAPYADLPALWSLRDFVNAVVSSLENQP